VPRDEALSVFRLVGRRADAGLVFADAGRRAARFAAREAPARALSRVTPGAMSRRLAARAATKTAREAFAAELRFPGGTAELRMAEPMSVIAWPDGGACGFYGAAFTELLRSLTGFEGTLRHETCRGRGDPACTWRAAAAEGYE
jgi:hypothetical protein